MVDAGLFYGMVKERMLATRAVNSIGIQCAKLPAYALFGALTFDPAKHGLAAGAGAALLASTLPRIALP